MRVISVSAERRPLRLHFPAGAGSLPAYSENGTTWTPIPRLAGLSLPDCHNVEPDGSIDIYTRHTTYYDILEALAPSAPVGLRASLHRDTLTLSREPPATALGIAGFRVLLDGKLLELGDHRRLELSPPVYDALYAWCRAQLQAAPSATP